MAGRTLLATGLFAAAMFCLIVVWGVAWEVARAVFKLDEVQWWKREITYAEIWRWLAGTIDEHLHVVVKMRREPFETDGSQGEASAAVRARIARAHRAQTERWGASSQDVEADRLPEDAVLTDGAAQLLDTARSKRGLSERRVETVLRVARTVADLALSARVEAVHVAEALGLQCAALDNGAEPRIE